MDHFGGTPPLISPAVQNFEILRVLYLAKLLILFMIVVSRVTVPISFRILDRFSPVLCECVFSELTPALSLINL